MKREIKIYDKAGACALLPPVAALRCFYFNRQSDRITDFYKRIYFSGVLPIKNATETILGTVGKVGKFVLGNIIGGHVLANYRKQFIPLLFNFFHNKKGAEAPLSIVKIQQYLKHRSYGSQYTPEHLPLIQILECRLDNLALFQIQCQINTQGYRHYYKELTHLLKTLTCTCFLEFSFFTADFTDLRWSFRL